MRNLFSKVPESADAKSVWWLGCHNCQELPIIVELFPKMRSLLLVDPLAPDLEKRVAGVDVSIRRAAATSKEQFEDLEGRAPFTMTSNAGASSSLRKMSRIHKRAFPSVWETRCVYTDLVWLGSLGAPPDVLIMDIQGCEYDVLCGAPDVVQEIKHIYAEVCYVELYDGQGMYSDLRRILEVAGGFTLVGVENEDVTYGNALWTRKEARDADNS